MAAIKVIDKAKLRIIGNLPGFEDTGDIDNYTAATGQKSGGDTPEPEAVTGGHTGFSRRSLNIATDRWHV
jgi:hypothetical protein